MGIKIPTRTHTHVLPIPTTHGFIHTDEPGGETAAPGEHQDHRGRPEDDRKRHDDKTNASCRDTVPGGHRGKQGESRGVKVDSDRRNVVDNDEFDGMCQGHKENERVVETDALCRDRGPTGHIGEQEVMGDVEDDCDRQNDVESRGYDGRWCWMDGATSAPRRKSKRLETEALAGYQTGQHEQRRDTTNDAPGPSIPPPNHHRQPTDHLNPPPRRGRLKSRPTRVSYPRWTYQVIRSRRSRPRLCNHFSRATTYHIG